MHEKYTKTLTNGVTGTVVESEDEFTIDLYEEYGVKQVGYFEVTPYRCSLAVRFNDDEHEHLICDALYDNQPFIIDNIAIQKIHIRPLTLSEISQINETTPSIRYSAITNADAPVRIYWKAKYK